jgi:hypothetical protein
VVHPTIRHSANQFPNRYSGKCQIDWKTVRTSGQVRADFLCQLVVHPTFRQLACHLVVVSKINPDCFPKHRLRYDPSASPSKRRSQFSPTFELTHHQCLLPAGPKLQSDGSSVNVPLGVLHHHLLPRLILRLLVLSPCSPSQCH